MTRRRSHLAIVLLALLAGCTVNGPPGLWERGWIESQKKTMVLIRLTAEGEDQQIVPGRKYLQLGIIDFADGTQEKPIAMTLARGLDGKSARDGWYFMILNPETHYLVVGVSHMPGDTTLFGEYLKSDDEGWVRIVRLRMDVPAGAEAVYAGSLHVPMRTRRLLFGRECTAITDEGVTIKDESSAAAALIGKKVSWAGPPQTALMTRHKQPTLQFRTFQSP